MNLLLGEEDTLMNRQPAVAGTFYPANPQQLHQMLDQYLNDAEMGGKVPKAIIAPHAGYIYSGPVAASAYARLKKAHDRITRVVVIGPSHRVAFSGLAVSHAQSFITPLGFIAVDQEAVAAIARLPFVDYLEQAHTFEHSLEVQLPFLQEMLDDFKIVPIVAGDATPAQVSQVIEALWGGDETLIVISSDLSHYHDYATAKQLDKATSSAIEHLQYERLGSDSACGKVPVSGLLKLAREKSLTIKTIDLRNSGDTAGDKSSVVGYGAYVIE
jgi:AmmeMemoRadiSam system protein B